MSCVALGKVLNLSVLPFPYMENGANNGASITGGYKDQRFSTYKSTRDNGWHIANLI